MSESIEVERKTLIDQTTFLKLINQFPKKTGFTQINDYYDSRDFILQANHIGLRIRRFDQVAEQTLKLPIDLADTTKRALKEVTDVLSLAQAKALLDQSIVDFQGNVGAYLNNHFPKRQMIHFATAETYRHLLIGPQGVLLTLDETHYPDGNKDFELEIENDNNHLAKDILQKLSEHYHFAIQPKNINKVERAYEHRIINR